MRSSFIINKIQKRKGKHRHNNITFALFLFLIYITVTEAFTLKMGLLKVGVPKKWEDSKSNLHYVRDAGVRQFINTWNRVKDLKGDELLWGDEIEYGIFELDPSRKKIRLSLRGREIMEDLNSQEQSHAHRSEGCNWVPEYGAWMVEATPNRPYTGYTNDLLRVERNMRLRRKRILSALKENEIAPTVSTFPLLGALGDDGSSPPTKVGGPITNSEYIGDGIINPHPRFGALTQNIRKRRGENVNISVPLYRDSKTPEYLKLIKEKPHLALGGCCGSDSLQLWRYGKGDPSRLKYGRDFVTVGCSSGSDIFNESQQHTLKKWLVDVKCEGCKGLFYRSAPGVIIPDADWPRNGDVVIGSLVSDLDLPETKGGPWIRLQNGYYLPTRSDCGKVPFLKEITSERDGRVAVEKKSSPGLGASKPIFLTGNENNDGVASLLDLVDEETEVDTAQEETPSMKKSELDLERLQPAIHMDAMAFGMGCCCLQVTFQACDVEESRFLYDQLAVLAPIMMALTASSPIFKGRLADIDARWGVISECVDCRSTKERGCPSAFEPDDEMAGRGVRRIYKSRYDSMSTFIYQGMTEEEESTSNKNRVLNVYNDIPVPIDEDKYKTLRAEGIDPALSQHISHLFIRDPLVVFEGAVEEVDDETQTEHFESIQSTNWQTVRWKPPPPRNSPNDPHIGWRTEFRSMEMQLTDFENAAFAVFITLITRIILVFDLNLYIPLSRIDLNMQRAHSRSAASKGKFFFRRHMAELEEGDDGFDKVYTSMFASVLNGDNSEEIDQKNSTSASPSSRRMKRKKRPLAQGANSEENSFEEMTMNEIMNGKGDYYPGLIPLVYAYLDYINCDSITMNQLTKYMEFIRKRASGELMTPATWMRNFVRSHPSYKHDSVVSDEIAYDLMVACKEIGEGTRECPEVLGDIKIKPLSMDTAWDQKLEGGTVQNQELLNLLKRYRKRNSFNQGGNQS